MRHSTRKEFLQTSGVLIAAAFTGSSFAIAKQAPLLSFSTLGCPDWTFQQIIDFAALHGYQGIEIRCIQRQLDLTKCPEFHNLASISATVSRVAGKKLQIVDLGSSCSLHISDPVKRKDNLDEAKRFIDLAQKINCPYIRVYPNNLPKDQDKQAVMELIIQGFKILGDYARGTGVQVLMETHGDLVHSEDLLNVMQSVDNPQTGLIWDISNMWTITKEPPAQVYSRLKKWIRHTHIKDAKLTKDEVKYVFLGQGEVPIFEAIDLLRKNNYKGYYSFEWEKMWHPELAEPDLALADYPEAMKKHFASA
jgi:sugar phosphate isomerase/epimerase